MSDESTPQARYVSITQELLNNPEVTQSKKKGFGSGLRVNGKVFAMLVKGRLVVKLPQERIDELSAMGQGEPYESGGRVTKDWVAVEPTADERWLPLTQEAMEFVESNHRSAGEE